MENELNLKNQLFLLNKKISEDLNKEKNSNKLSENKIKYLQNLLNEAIQNNLNGAQEDSKISFEKDKKIEELKNELSRFPFRLSDNEKIIFININSYDESIRASILCKNKDKFEEIEKNFYKLFPEYSNLNCVFTINGKKIDKYKNLDENNIYNDALIIVIEQ